MNLIKIGCWEFRWFEKDTKSWSLSRADRSKGAGEVIPERKEFDILVCKISWLSNSWNGSVLDRHLINISKLEWIGCLLIINWVERNESDCNFRDPIELIKLKLLKYIGWKDRSSRCDVDLFYVHSCNRLWNQSMSFEH